MWLSRRAVWAVSPDTPGNWQKKCVALQDTHTPTAMHRTGMGKAFPREIVTSQYFGVLD
jgi:hypothetical protein